jgi:hypothetical protein
MKKYLPFLVIGIVCLAVGFFIGFFKSPALGITPKTNALGVYFTTTTDYTIRDTYGTPLRVDQNGRLITVQ